MRSQMKVAPFSCTLVVTVVRADHMAEEGAGGFVHELAALRPHVEDDCMNGRWRWYIVRLNFLLRTHPPGTLTYIRKRKESAVRHEPNRTHTGDV